MNRGGAPGTIRRWDVSESGGNWSITQQDTDHDGFVDVVQIQVLMFQSQNGLGENYVWFLSFSSSRIPGPLAPGFYGGAMLFGRETSGHPGMKIATGCSSISGDFTVLDAEYYQGAVVRFAARFTQHCDGLTYSRSGTVYFNSMGAVQPLAIKTSSLPDAATGIEYSQNLVAEGGTQPYTWKLASGQVPPGLSLTTSGLLSGTPTSIGSFSFAAHVTDTSDARGLPKQTAEASFMVSVRDSELVVTSASPPRGMKGADYSYQLTAQGGSPPYTWRLADGLLPPGLAVNSDGAVSGSPTVAGRFDFAVQVADSILRTTSQSYAITVIDPPRITEVVYKAKKLKLTLTGEKFDEMATLFIDGHEVRPKNHDETWFVVKQLLLEPGTHDIRIVNPDGGTATVALTVP